MTTPFALITDRCGLSVREAAELLQVREDTVKSWRAGRNRTPEQVMRDMRALYAKIETAASEALAIIGQAPADVEIELGIAADDHEARSIGWPCVGAQAASLGLIAAKTDRRLRLVPRGSTTATAAAADANEIVAKPRH